MKANKIATIILAVASFSVSAMDLKLPPIELAGVQMIAAGFDIWSTQRGIATGRFAENNALCAPICGRQPSTTSLILFDLGSVLINYEIGNFLYHQNNWLKHLWFVPQVCFSLGHVYGTSSNLYLYQKYVER